MPSCVSPGWIPTVRGEVYVARRRPLRRMRRRRLGVASPEEASRIGTSRPHASVAEEGGLVAPCGVRGPDDDPDAAWQPPCWCCHARSPWPVTAPTLTGLDLAAGRSLLGDGDRSAFADRDRCRRAAARSPACTRLNARNYRPARGRAATNAGSVTRGPDLLAGARSCPSAGAPLHGERGTHAVVGQGCEALHLGLGRRRLHLTSRCSRCAGDLACGRGRNRLVRPVVAELHDGAQRPSRPARVGRQPSVTSSRRTLPAWSTSTVPVTRVPRLNSLSSVSSKA